FSCACRDGAPASKLNAVIPEIHFAAAAHGGPDKTRWANVIRAFIGIVSPQKACRAARGRPARLSRTANWSNSLACELICKFHLVGAQGQRKAGCDILGAGEIQMNDRACQTGAQNGVGVPSAAELKNQV